MTLVKTKITRKSALIKALKNLGFKSHMIEQSETPMNIRGYSGDTRKQQCHIRIKGAGWADNYVGNSSNDIGWERLEDGSYAFHVSEYDSHKYNKPWQNKLLQQYGKEVVKEIAVEQNYFIESEEEESGEIVIKLSSLY